MYTRHFGLTEEPFSIAANPRFLYMSANHREALAHLLYGIRSDSGFVLLTGEVGTGKTTVCRCLLEQLPEDTEVAYILNPRVSEVEMLASICDELGIEHPRQDCSVKTLVDAINLHLLERHADGRKTVVIIDEAQNLSHAVLEQLRLLTNLETNERKLVRIILIGQPELAPMLSCPELKQVEQRITARYHLQPLRRSEIGAYVTHRLAVAGQRKTVFSAAVLGRLYNKTGGIPRLINVMCDRAMLGAYVKSQHKVNASILEKAAREVLGGSTRSRWLLPGSVVASILLVGVATAAVFFYDGDEDNTKLFSKQTNETVAEPEPFIEESKEAPKENEAEVVVEDPPMTTGIEPEWPDRVIAKDNALAVAQKLLFRQWRISVADNVTDPCGRIADHNLRCYSGVGNLGGLVSDDRPAILTMVDNQGQLYYATLVALNRDLATLAFAHGIETVAVSDLETRWQGQYQLLWRLSPGGVSIFRPGDRGEAVTWLTKNMLTAGIGSVQEQELYDADVIEAVRSFQVKRGLRADGVAGRQTLIQLSSINDQTVPRLSSEGDR